MKLQNEFLESMILLQNMNYQLIGTMGTVDYYKNHGTSWLSQADNPNKSLTVRDWDIFAFQLSYRF